MRSYTAAEIASELGTDGKTLRRLVRNAPQFKNAGSGARYVFTTADLPALRTLVDAHNGKAKGSRAKGVSLIDDNPGLTVREARDPELVRRITEERVDRLEAALRKRGMHISQMRDRSTWEPRHTMPA